MKSELNLQVSRVGSSQTIRIGDALSRQKDVVIIEDNESYKRLTIRMNGLGVELRDTKMGFEIGTKRQFRVKSGQFILSKIDARNGAFGLVPDICDQAVITGNFWTFDVDAGLLNTQYFEFLTKTPSFVDFCIRASDGTTNRRYLDEDLFLNQLIEIPSPDEQRRIVAKIDALATRIDEARRLREEIQRDAQAMLRSAFQHVIEGAEYRPMAEVAPIVRRKVEIEMDGEYPELGVRSFHKGTFFKGVSNGADIAHKKMFHIEPGDLIFSNIMAWEGAIAVAKPEDKGRIGVHRFITCVPVDGVTTSDFLGFYFQTSKGFQKIVEASPATIARNRTLSIKKLEKIEVPIPPYEKQLWFNHLQQKVATIQQAQAGNQTELDALLPSILDKAFKGDL